MSADKPALTPAAWKGLIASIAAISVAGAGFGHSLPLFSLLLEGYGVSDSNIGLNAGTAAIAAIIATPLFPRIIPVIGIKNFLLVCVATMVVTYAGLYVAGAHVFWWFPLRFVFGMAGAGLFVGSEIWINALAPDHIRGRIIGLYGTFLALGFALGPWLIDLVGYDGIIPFIAGMAVFGSAAIPIIWAPPPPPAPEDAAHGFFHLIPKAPATFLAPAIFAGIESALLVFLPVIAIENGWGGVVGARAISIYGFGVVALQYLIGRYSETIGYGRALLWCAQLSFVGALAFLIALTSIPLTYAVMFIWGGVVAGLYTIALTLIGDRFEPRERSASNTGYVFMYGVGAVFGPVLAGFARDLFGPQALPWFIILVLGAYALLVWQRWTLHKP